MLKGIEGWALSLITLLVVAVAIGRNPACSAAALLVLLAFRIADKYFHDTFYDENRQGIAQIRGDLAKIKAKQDQADLKAAFGGKHG